MRNTLLKAISEKIVEDDKLIILLGDLGVFQMKKAMKEYPSRVLNFGIMEQTMIGFSAGIAKGDYYPIIYSITPFLVDRAYEQIKLDLIYNKNNALILSAGASFDYSTLGPTHHCPHDISNLLSINHPFLTHPFTKKQSKDILHFILQKKIQAYMRISTAELDLSANLNFEKSHSINEIQELPNWDKFLSKNFLSHKNLVILFGPDSIYLRNSNDLINNSDAVITISSINKKMFRELALEIIKFKKVFILIPYEPSQIILKLMSMINTKKRPESILVIHPKALFHDNSYEKADIFQKNTEETRII